MAFAGLARPEVFAATLQELGVDLKGFQAFPDHHAYSPEELDRLTEAARALGAEGPDHHRQGLGHAWESAGTGASPCGSWKWRPGWGKPEQVLELLDRNRTG